MADIRGILALSLTATLAAGCVVSPAPQPGILIIGTTGRFRACEVAERRELYRGYVKSAAQTHPGTPPTLGDEAFQAKLAGWASIQTSGIPLVMSWRVRMLVPKTVVQGTQFAAAADSILFGGTGDLVAASSDRDGVVWIDRVLCRAGDSFSECAKKYQAGIFDENTGQELARNRKPKPDGALVDVTSYVSLAQDPDRHTASELDPRALNRCDHCKGAIPGSTQSTVQVPQSENH